MGYNKIYCFEGGIPEWRSFNYPMSVKQDYADIKIKKISPRDLFTLLQKQTDLYVLDVRPLACDQPNAFIKESIVCPMVYLADWLDNIPKDREIVVADWANKKSIFAAKFLLSQGYNVTYVLKGGVARWHNEKLPVDFRSDPYQTFTNNPCQNQE